MDDFFDDLQQTPRNNISSSESKPESENMNSQDASQSQGTSVITNSEGLHSEITNVDEKSLKREDCKVKDINAIKEMLSEMGVTHYEPEVVDGLLEYAYKFMHSVVDDARLYSRHAKKTEVDVSDVKLALQLRAGQDVVQPIPRELMTEVAKKKNAVPLPQVKSGVGLRLPTDRYCLTQPNYKLKPSTSLSAGRGELTKPYSRQQQFRQQSQSTNSEYAKSYRPMNFQSPHKPMTNQTVNVTPQTRHQFINSNTNLSLNQSPHQIVTTVVQRPSSQHQQLVQSQPVHFQQHMSGYAGNNPR